eukprot:CAMPEP_0114115020 /NCGR_PEP_ID=MMETSP0043_2-20121206/3747_1 /TAXON_ID=464988 /ORGANISM="Hemiselmis andersenii, Strain CCMP644" /LENGTH=37 /DNA_ID= /DNA_START= /DNA_END= /DNA_ORIENTATION=
MLDGVMGTPSTATTTSPFEMAPDKWAGPPHAMLVTLA